MPEPECPVEAPPQPAEQVEEVEEVDVASLFAPLTAAEVTNSMFSTWYPLLRHSTFKSAVLKPLAPEFLSYLQTDGIFLPDNEATPQYGSRIDAVDSDSDWSDDEPDVHVNLDSTSAEIRSALKELGGSV
ncbi:hypothetical protein EC988_003963, partial [Linderina pennispora]